MLGVSHHLLGNQATARRRCETALKAESIQNSSLVRFGFDQRIRAVLALARRFWLCRATLAGTYASTAALLKVFDMQLDDGDCCRLLSDWKAGSGRGLTSSRDQTV
jgi:hypothetical protein